ncbi:MAG: D-TA family PLP-dependent enzyme [Tunicatimonas sp.]|uniref:D-TA family PLP-dependent enzyme n=1 Tax=Tunicatimonas sp. TaxID=1940096 RepID=UPI003C792E6E
MNQWFKISNANELLSPALLFYPNRIDANIDRMISIAGSAQRLRPHSKTYKCREIIEMQLAKGIRKFKCATLAEAQLLAESGASEILLAYPIIGPAQDRLVALTKQYSRIKFAVLLDHQEHIAQWGQRGVSMSVFIDLDVGMHRTGIETEAATKLFKQVQQSDLSFQGWHAYDGHLRQSAPEERSKATQIGMAGLDALLEQTQTQSAEIVCGGSITFPIHARHPERQLSPGTTLLWDYGYSQFTDLPFDIAACLFTRVISKPGQGLLCLDLGHKAVASETKGAPVYFPQLADAAITTHSEEHMVVRTTQADQWNIGDVLYGWPWHICPTVALHQQAGIVTNHRLNSFWEITARHRIYQ